MLLSCEGLPPPPKGHGLLVGTLTMLMCVGRWLLGWLALSDGRAARLLASC